MPGASSRGVACVTVVYILVSIAAVSVVPYARLGDLSLGAPLAQITAVAAPWLPKNTYTFITLFAVANTALMNFIMGSRLMYGMAKQGLLPSALGTVHRSRRTPYVAILVLALMVSGLAFAGDIKDLASATSLLLLLVFALMNASLIVLKLRKGEEPGKFEIPLFIPILGCIVCFVLIGSRLASAGADPKPPSSPSRSSSSSAFCTSSCARTARSWSVWTEVERNRLQFPSLRALSLARISEKCASLPLWPCWRFFPSRRASSLKLLLPPPPLPRRSSQWRL